MRERKRSSENSTEAKNNPQRRINYGWGSNLKIAEKGFQELEPRHTSGRKPTRQLPERVMRREGRAKLQKFQPVQESPGGGDTKGQQTKLLTSLDGLGGPKRTHRNSPKLGGKNSHARRWRPTGRRAGAGISARNLHLRSKPELPGIAWKQGGPDRSRFAEENFFQAERQKRKFATFWPEGGKGGCFFWPKRGKETFFRTGRQKGKFVTFWPCLIGRKGKILRAKESCALQKISA